MAGPLKRVVASFLQRKHPLGLQDPTLHPERAQRPEAAKYNHTEYSNTRPEMT